MLTWIPRSTACHWNDRAVSESGRVGEPIVRLFALGWGNDTAISITSADCLTRWPGRVPFVWASGLPATWRWKLQKQGWKTARTPRRIESWETSHAASSRAFAERNRHRAWSSTRCSRHSSPLPQSVLLPCSATASPMSSTPWRASWPTSPPDLPGHSHSTIGGTSALEGAVPPDIGAPPSASSCASYPCTSNRGPACCNGFPPD
jgi:hypothetical protein